MRIIEYISSCIEQYDMTPAMQDDMTPIKQEIIRCKDCKYYRKDRFVCDLTKYASTEDDFCSWAERKDNEIEE